MHASRARVPERLKPGRPIEHPVPDTRELSERQCEHGPRGLPVQTLACAGGVDTVREIVQPREDCLDHRIPSWGVRAAPVDVRDEELARAGRGGGEDPDLGEDYLGGGLEVCPTVGYTREGLV